MEEDLTVLVEGRTGVTWFLGALEGTFAGTPFAAVDTPAPGFTTTTTTTTTAGVSWPPKPAPGDGDSFRYE